MLKKILRFLASSLLVLLPFFPLPEIALGTEVGYSDFPDYLTVCGFLVLLTVCLGFFLVKTNKPERSHSRELAWAAALLFCLGFVVMIPLHMGPPREGVDLVQASGEEKFRYALLLLAVIVFALGYFLILKHFWPGLNRVKKALVFPLFVALMISLWDYFDSFMFSDKLNQWIGEGKNAADFFPNYNFHHVWRAAGRILLYVVAAYASVVLTSASVIKKGTCIALTLFSIAGIFFCVVFLTAGFDYYFPFMVPAIALAPTYWLGIALLKNVAFSKKSAS